MYICRFCSKWANDDDLVKYGVRHHAHFTCYLDAGKRLAALSAWQVGQFPVLLLDERGLLDEAKRLSVGAAFKARAV